MTLHQSLRRMHVAAAAHDPDYYAGFAHPEDLMMKIDLGYAVLAAVLCSGQFFAPSGEPDAYARKRGDVDAGVLIARGGSAVSHALDTTPEHTAVYVDFEPIRVRVLGLGSETTPEQSGALAGARRILRSVFPNLDLERIGAQGQRLRQFPVEDAAARELPLELLSAINVPGVARLDLGDWKAPLRGAVRLQCTPTVVRTTEYTDRITDHTDFDITVEVRARIELPREFCEWSQHAGKDDYVPLATWLHFHSQRAWAIGTSDEDEVPAARIPHPDAVAQTARAAVAKYHLGSAPRTDDYGICCLPDGRMVYVPSVPSASISGMMGECVQQGKIDLDPLRNRHVFTDWTIHKMGLSDDEGTMHMVNLTGARPPTPLVIAHVSNWRIDEDRLKSMESLGTRLGVPFSITPVAGLEDVEWCNLMDVPYHGSEVPHEQRTNEQLFAIGRRLGELYVKLASSNTSLYEQFEIRPFIALFGPYREQRERGVRDLGNQIDHNRVGVDATAVPRLHNMPGVEGVMPHQRRVLSTLATAPAGAILDVRAGGGKSLASIYDINNLMASGAVQRPVVIMPRNLLGPYATEVTRFTNGRLRPFIVSNRVWRTMVRRYGTNGTAIVDLMRRQPRNTVFLVDYGWLTHNAESVALGEDEEQFFPHAAMLCGINPDYCCLDESHRAKKISSGRTLAASMISGMCKYRRIMSGTLLHNTAVDLLGQMAQIEPMALGHLGASIRENRRVSISQLPELRKCTDAFARSISVPRKEWAHLLPPMVERVHPCEMTPKQREFYDKIYARLQDDIQKDPKFRALMKKDSAAAEARIAAIFKRKFVPLEQWLNAPDSEFSANQFGQVFSQLDGLGVADLRSPKIDVLDDILDQHLNGGSVELENGVETHVPPSGNKCIIFCYNKAVVDHVFRHSRHARRGVMYNAGDDAALTKFKEDPDVIFLYAAVTSMAEGHNLQCFPGYTQVLTDYGQSVPIEEVFSNPNITHVLSYDLKKRRIERKRITRKLRHEVLDDDRYVQITVRDTRDDRVSSLTVTDEHPIFLKGGREVQAGSLKAGDRLITYGGEFVKSATHPSTGEVVPCTALKGLPKFYVCKTCGEKVTGQARLSHMFKAHGLKEKEYRKYRRDKVRASRAAHDVPENRAKYLKNLRAVWKDPAFRERMRDARFQAWDNPARRGAASLRMREMWKTPEFRDIQLAGMLLYWSTPEASENQSRRSRENWERNSDAMLQAIRSFTDTPEYREKMSALSVSMWQDPDIRERIVASMVVAANTPERRELRRAATRLLHERDGFTEKTVAAMLQGQGVFPNRPERAVIDLGYDALKYTGDGRYYTQLTLNGRSIKKNPDFISTDHYVIDGRGRKRTTKVIEVIGARKYTGRDVSYDRKLVRAYKDVGIDCLIIDDKEALNPNVASSKIESLLNNHDLIVERVVEAPRRHRATTVGRYKYDIDVEGNHNFFACAGSQVPKRPLIPILVHNCADRVVEMQSYWTPGLGEQSMARVWRPDVPDANGQIKYKRDRIFRDIILITPSVEVAKMARLISKQVSNLLVEEIDSSLALKQMVRSNESTFEQMKPVKMNLDSLKKLQDRPALATYFRAYALVKQWERKEFSDARNRVRAEIEERVGHRVSNSELSAASMTRPENVNTNDFDVANALQAQGYVPWTDGFTGYNPTGLRLVPLEMPKAPDEDDEEADTQDEADATEDEELVHVERGDPVLTELGPGYVASARANARSVNVIVPGFSGEPVRLWRYTVLAATSPVDKKALDLIIKRSGAGGRALLKVGPNGELGGQRNPVPDESVRAVMAEATRLVAAGTPARGIVTPPPPRPAARLPVGTAPATRENLVRERGRITIGNHEAVLLRSRKTGEPAWIVRHQSDARDRSKPYPTDQKRAAINDLLARHNAAVGTPAAGRSRGVAPDDPFVGTRKRAGVPPVVTATPSRAVRPAAKSAPLSLTNVDQHEEKRDVREAAAGVFSGTVCLITTDGGDRDTLLLKSGFDRLAKRLEIRVKNPRAFRLLAQLLMSKFDVPAINAKALQMFADQYAAAKAQVAYLRAKEMPQHAAWLRQQKTKGKTPMTIMPWPVVRNGAVYVMINAEQLQGKATSALRRITLPVGCVKPVIAEPQMIAMLTSVAAGKRLMVQLKRRGVDIENQSSVIEALRKIKG